MTRINLIPPVELMDQHLIAEYKEIQQLVGGLRVSFRTARGVSKDRIPKNFTLNTGHCLFFADKGAYIRRRYKMVLVEMQVRGFNTKSNDIDISVWPDGYFNDWEPDEQDMSVVRDRIKQKLEMKPTWYRYYGVPLTIGE